MLMRLQLILFTLLVSVTTRAIDEPAETTAASTTPASNFTSELRGAGQSQVCPQADPSSQDARYQELIDEAKKGIQPPGGTR